MKRLIPRSLVGQIALVMAVALLIAQAINFSLILTERQRLSRARSEGPAIGRFVNFAQLLTPLDVSDRARLVPRDSRRGRVWISGESIISGGASDPQLAERLREGAAASGLDIKDARALVSERAILPAPRPGESEARRQRLERHIHRFRTLVLSAQLPDGSWVNAHTLLPRPDPWLAARPALATLLTYLIVLGAMIWMAARLIRPLRRLATAAEQFRGQGEFPHVEPSGPRDLQRAMIAFNSMGARVSAMMDEKDRMLGAIGHDLRSPIASLRIRAESIEPEEERLRIVATLEEMTAMLDDTLALARSGRAVEAVRPVDLTALADTVVEEHVARNHDVQMAAGPRITARVQPNLLRRAIRNLVDNAVKYGESARVSVEEVGQEVAIRIEDEGPGLEEDELEKVVEPFYRTEPSRSRETGGAGLGLTLARAAAQAHGGRLALANRPEGGLAATIFIPRD